MNVYLCQVNNTYGLNAFLPYSVALLQSYALTIPTIKENYNFKGFFYLREPLENILNKLENPSVFGISCYIWNWEYSIALAQKVKESYPNCLIVLGGPHVPDRSDGFFLKYSFVDLLVHNEGEVTFSEILLEKLKGNNYENIQGLSINANGKTIKTPVRTRITDLELIPSPYLTGIFDELIFEPYDFHASQETHRGCLASGTSIITFTGKKNIEDIQPGERVLGWDENKQNYVWNTVEKSICNGEKEVLLIKIGEKYVKATGDHPFYTTRGWVEASKLTKEDSVLCCEHYIKIESILISGIEKVYDLINAKPFPNFFANEILVHNCPYFCAFCLSEDALIQTDKGAKKISSIMGGDKILGWDEINNKITWNTVQQLQYNGEKPTLKIEIEKEYLEITDNHLIYTGDGWKTAAELISGDKVLYQQKETPIKSITKSGVKKVYDIINALPTHNFFANGILVSNCDWGSSVFTKVRMFNTERLIKELKWMAQYKIDLIYNCDANYALFERDVELTRQMAEIKKQNGFPKKFRAAYAKNSNDRVYQVAKILNDADMNKGITLSFQSMDDNTLEIIKRKNIKVKDFTNLMQKYRSENIATYSEIIVGLPGETYDTFADGLNTLIQCGQHDSINIYICLAEGSLVMTPKGKIPIESINSGDEVLGWDEKSNKVITNKVKHKICNGIHEIYRIKYGKEKIETTGNHPIYTSDGWKKVSEIKPGDKVLFNMQYNNTESQGCKILFPEVLSQSSEIENHKILYNVQYTNDRQKTTSEIFRFYPYYTQDKKSNISSWNLLAQEGRFSETRIGRLSESRMGYIYNLGKSKFRQGNDEKDSKVCWVKIESIECAGKKKVYDLVNVTPFPNFFANGILVHNCEVLPNAELNNPEYIKKHGIKSVKVPVLFFHGTPSHDPYQEHYELITETASLPKKDWLRCNRFAWAIQCFHCLSLTQCIAVYLNKRGINYRTFYEKLLDFADNNPDTIIGQITTEITKLYEGILEGKGWGIVDQRFGDIIWPPEEGAFLKIIVEKEKFYKEIKSFIDVPEDLIEYQKNILVDPYQTGDIDLNLSCNLHEYLQKIYSNQDFELEYKPTCYKIKNPKDYNGDLPSYAKEIIWYQRKAGKFKYTDIIKL